MRKADVKAIKVPNHVAGLVFFLSAYLAAVAVVMLVDPVIAQLLRGMTIAFMASLAVMIATFLLAQRFKRIDIVDSAWGITFVAAAISTFIANPYGVSLGWNTQTVVTVLVMIWGVRLSYHIGKRFLRSSEEDARYIALRKKWKGNMALNAFLRIFLVQAVLATLISAAAVHINFSVPKTPTYFVYAGAIIWLIGFAFEVIADRQLKKFLANPANKGKLMTQGLWKYTRHPNYFGEALLWFGIAFIAFSTSYGWVGLLTPVVITYLLLFVSGVPMAEASHKKKPGWEAYKQRTSKFIPLLPIR